jgi:hypothetical protein
MTDQVFEAGGVRVLACDPSGPVLAKAGDVSDYISAAWETKAALVAIPVERLPEDFFRLRTGLAGEAIQKFVNYRIRLAVVGDIGHFVEASDALRDFIVESNRGDHVWFLADIDELRARLGG